MSLRAFIAIALAAVAALIHAADASPAVRLAVAVRGDRAELAPATLARLAAAGVDALMVNPRSVGAERLRSIRRAARRASLRVVGPRAVWAASVDEAVAASSPARPVVARIADADAFNRLDASALRGRLFAAVTVGSASAADAWAAALARTRAGPVTLTLAPARRVLSPGFLRLLARYRAPRPADLYLAPAGSDDGPCTPAVPCRTLERAWELAAAGQVVELASGSYPAAVLRPVARSSSERVVFRPAAGASPVIQGRLAVYGSHVEVRSLRAGAWYLRAPADDIVLRDVDVDTFAIVSATNVSIMGGDVGPHENGDPLIGQYQGPTPTGIVIDGVRFHDFVKTDPAAHTECLQFTAGIDVTIRNSRFERCSDHTILVKPDQGPIRNFLIENNWFGRTLRGYYTLRLAPVPGRVCENVLVRNNSALQEMYSDCEARNVRLVANIQPIMRGYACSTSTRRGAVWDWNVYGDGVPCGPNDIVAPLGFRDPASFDLHLVPGAPAIGRGDPSSVPDSDVDGDPRPLGRADAGADERP